MIRYKNRIGKVFNKVIFILFILDLILCFGSYLLSLFLRTEFHFFIFRDVIPLDRINFDLFSLIIVLAAQTISFYFLGLYDLIDNKEYKFNLKDIILACIVSLMLVITIYFFSNYFQYQRSVILVFIVIQITFISIYRKIVSRLLKQENKIKNIIFVGRTNIAKSLILQIETDPYLKKKYNIIGVLSLNNEYNSHNKKKKEETFLGHPILGSKENIKEILSQFNIDELLIATERNWQDEVLKDVREYFEHEKLHIQPNIKIIPSPYEIKIGKLKFSKIHDIPMFGIEDKLNKNHQIIIKRCFDIIFSAILLLISSPIFLISMLIIKLTSHGPAFYYQKRLGKDMKRFTIIKFRTMIHGAERQSGITLSPENDTRITKSGKILRTLRIDELPQLINVLKGDMSFVGPRPERMFFVRKFVKEIDSYIERFKVKPGLTGLAQIQGHYHTKANVKIKYDLAYIYNWSIWLEFRILMETIKVVLTRRGH